MAKYDDLVEEASGELDRVEGQLYSATQQLLDLQGKLSQLTQEAHAADKTKLRVKPCSSSLCPQLLQMNCTYFAWILRLLTVHTHVVYTDMAHACCDNGDGCFHHSV